MSETLYKKQEKIQKKKRKTKKRERPRERERGREILLCNGRFRFAHSNLTALFNGLATIPDNASLGLTPLSPLLLPLCNLLLQTLPPPTVPCNPSFACRDKNLLHNSKSEAAELQLQRPGEAQAAPSPKQCLKYCPSDCPSVRPSYCLPDPYINSLW